MVIYSDFLSSFKQYKSSSNYIIINKQNIKKMVKQFPRNSRLIVLVLFLINILGNAQIISVNLSSIPNSSIDATSQIASNITPQFEAQVKNNDLYYDILKTSFSKASTENGSEIDSFGTKSASKQSIENVYDQFIVPVDESWSSFGNLTLQILASNQFYANNGKSTPKKQSANNTISNSNLPNVLNQAQNMTPKASSPPVEASKKDSNNELMTQNQLKSLEIQLTQVQQRANNAISNTIQPKVTNPQYSPVAYTQQYGAGSNLASNVVNNPSDVLIFSSKNDEDKVANNNLMIENLKSTINSRFNSFFGS